MDYEEAGRLWNDNAEAWTGLARAGFDVYRDNLNTPAFFALLPDVAGLAGLDIGCGEGRNTRLLARPPPEANAGLAQFRTPRFTRTLSQWLNLLTDTGFRLERLAEPRPG